VNHDRTYWLSSHGASALVIASGFLGIAIGVQVGGASTATSFVVWTIVGIALIVGLSVLATCFAVRTTRAARARGDRMPQ